jgi:polyferredoxin/tetratricopeptide (TPR) repeat protein
MAKWRAAVLILLHIAIAAHLLHWWWTGRSLARFVMSDSMQTLERGEINPGFLLFAAAILVTASAGRFMCGWACHMGALQDLCAWILRRMGIRPRLFRSRVLGYVPVGLALYMFVWPTAARIVVKPAAETISPSLSAWLGPSTTFPGFSAALSSDQLWEGLPSIWVAIPFLLLCGCATVYFLGARGLCRYGCPYGGFLLAAEQVAPIRVTVDPERCDQCGLCTAACTTGVRVHDEIRLYGAVLDRNCVRSLDCISVCPQNALSLRLVKPAALTSRSTSPFPRTSSALSWKEELAIAAVFLLSFFTVRGLYGLIPMLLAATIGILAAFGAAMLLRLPRARDMCAGQWQLKRNHHLTRPGWAFIALSTLAALLLIHSAAIRLCILRAESIDDQVTVSYDLAWSGTPIPDAQKEFAKSALRWYQAAAPISRGGLGLTMTPASSVRIAWLELVAGERDQAIDELRFLAHSGRGADNAAAELGRLLLATGQPDQAESELKQLSQQGPTWPQTRDLLCGLWATSNRADQAIAHCRAALQSNPHNNRARLTLARVLLTTGQAEEGLREAATAAADAPADSQLRADHARLLFTAGHLPEALTELESAATARPAARPALLNLGATMLERAGQPARASEWRQQAGSSTAQPTAGQPR